MDEIFRSIYKIKDQKYPPEPKISWIEKDLEKVLNGDYTSARKYAENLAFGIGLVRKAVNEVLDWSQNVLYIDKNTMDELLILKEVISNKNPELNDPISRIEKDIRRRQIKRYSSIPKQLMDLYNYANELYETIGSSPIYKQIKQAEEEFDEILNSKKF